MELSKKLNNGSIWYKCIDISWVWLNYVYAHELKMTINSFWEKGNCYHAKIISEVEILQTRSKVIKMSELLKKELSEPPLNEKKI